MSGTDNITDIVNSINNEIVVTHNAPPDFFVLKENKDKSQSVWIKEPVTKMVKKRTFNFKSAGKYTITVNNIIIDKIKVPVDAEVRKRKSDSKNTYILFKKLDEKVFAS